jgi:polyphenol oxidase
VSFPASWLQPDWPAPPSVRAVFTSREGGVSQVPYDSMNLGDHVGDNATQVQINRNELQRRMGARCVFLQQVHGTEVLPLSAQTPDGVKADACMTEEENLACTIMVADCLPVLLSNRAGTRVAALHAGWRGLSAGVVQATVHALGEPSTVMAWMGPCIGPKAFEVGAEVREAFVRAVQGTPTVAQLGAVERCFSPLSAGKYMADLPGLARLSLRAAGVHSIHGNDGGDAWCTVRNASVFFSHRRDSAARAGNICSTGRMAACIWRV